MGFPKALMPIEGEPALLKLTRVFCKAQQENIYIILPESLLENLAIIKLRIDYPVKILINYYYNYGFAGSIKTALELILDKNYDGLFITPVDAPFLDLRLIQVITNLAHDKPEKIIIPSYTALPGHPVYIPKKFFYELNNYLGIKNLRNFLKHKSNFLLYLAWHNKNILANINTHSILEKYNLAGKAVL
jgi:CTP:molybdopterin cytidylyltransferase MocA